MSADAGSWIKRALTVVGWLLLAGWVALWAHAWRADHFHPPARMWLDPWITLGCDFDINYYAVREKAAGGNPYHRYLKGGTEPLQYDHPPLVLRLFYWCNWVDNRTARPLWMAVQVLILGLAIFAIGRARGELGLTAIPTPLLAALILWSFPVLFELERGNWNVLVLLGVLVLVPLLRARSTARDLAAGVAAGVTAWIKMYPGLLLVGLVALRRWRAAAVCVVTLAAIAAIDHPRIPDFAASIRKSASFTQDTVRHHWQASHTVSGAWQLFCKDIHAPLLARLPGTAGWLILVFPMVAYVSWRVWQTADPRRLLLPYLLWLVAAATFAPAIANDYNLYFVLLAGLACWDRHDGLVFKLGIVAAVVWWQPFLVPLAKGQGTAKVLWYCKLATLHLVGWVVARSAAREAVASSRDREVATPAAARAAA